MGCSTSMRMAPVLSRTDFASQPRKGKAISTYNSLRWGPPKSLMWQATGKFEVGAGPLHA